MGLVYKITDPEMDIKEIHRKVYDELAIKKPEIFSYRKSITEAETIGSDSYYYILSRNVKAYEEELEFFSVKPLYNVINSIFFKLGVSAATSTFLISIISYFLLISLIFLFLNKQLKKTELAFVITILISMFKPLLDSTRHATPDMLGCLLLLLTSYFFIYRKNILATTIFAMLTILTRPEYFILFGLLLVLILIFKQYFPYKLSEIGISYLFILLSFIMIQLYSKISWGVLFMNQFTKVQIYPISNPDPFVLSDYINYVKRKIFLEFNSSYFIILLIFTIVILGNALFNKYKTDKKPIVVLSFIVTIIISVFIRFLAFPALVNRMMVGFYLLIILALTLYQFSDRKNVCQ
jgi:hypothetical protein